MALKLTAKRVLEGKKPVVISATVTVPASSPVWGLSLTLTPTDSSIPSAANSSSPPPAEPVPGKPIRQATALLTGQENMLSLIAPCFDSDIARIKKQRLKENEDSWVLESSEFASCANGNEVLTVADDVLSRIQQILALYCNFTPIFSVDCICWINAAGESLRTIRASDTINVTSSKGLAELRSVSEEKPLGSMVFELMTRDAEVDEALTLHGDGGLSWSEVYDIIDFVGGVNSIVKEKYATRKQANSVRQTANHYRHQGSRRKPPLSRNAPTLTQANAFARNILKGWISSRLREDARKSR